MTHPHIPYDQALIDEIAAEMDLRVPNKEALEAIAHSFDDADGQPFEAVADLATAVGKTYLAAALIDYLAANGVRNFLIVTPGRTILTKTRNNFTENHPKSVLRGMVTRPLVVTEDNFNTGEVAAALDDDEVTKVFIYTVQALIKPKDKARRKTRTLQEQLGTDLYSHFVGAGDLVVISDEHHVYAESATAFSAAIRDLDAMALVGLTATPDKADLPKVVYHYPLARAIAEKFVKTPVLVGRKDTRNDVEIRLRDGMELLAAKTTAANEYAAATGKPTVNPVMFVVCRSIEDANDVAAVLHKPGFYPDDYDERVLVIHSDAPDDNLARLELVEDPASKVRVIVSVSMLKEGWDVKNIFVICSLRPSISDVLTEQTLGRGLRLPWGEYTGVELLDTVEVLSHERFEELLKKAGILLEGLVETRGGDKAAKKPAQAVPAVVPASAAGVIAEAAVPGTDDVIAISDATPGAATPASDIQALDDSGTPAPSAVIPVASAEDRLAGAKAQAQQLSQAVAADPGITIRIPRVERTVTARSFELSSLTDDEFTALGRKFADEGGTGLNRKVLDVVKDPTAELGFRLAPREGTAIVTAAAPELPVGGVKPFLRDTVLGRPFVPGDKVSAGAANRLAAAVVAGAGDEERLAAHLNAVANAVATVLDRMYRTSPPVFTTTVTDEPFTPTRLNTRTVEHNRFAPFSRRAAYDGWTRSLHGLNWFDSEPERALANLLDGDADVALWARIQRSDGVTIKTATGIGYTPDFYVRATDGTNYLIEVKADDQADSAGVQERAKAAKEWTRLAADSGYGTWRYLLVSESTLATAGTFAALVRQAQA